MKRITPMLGLLNGVNGNEVIVVGAVGGISKTYNQFELKGETCGT